ncbi:hypothetical protein L3X38_011021 [Prunus dulcis]|uniref:Uncharacterized protein n=1 Tax=Prunus dulcis TaxID=3755 RepID=A0AAD4WGL3_PRUDU|nr:hypothetical protein L3X38_011021 [Prunus dulcis]
MSNFLVGQPSWDCSSPNSLNFRASELSKGLVLDGGGQIHTRHINPFLLVDVGCYMWSSGEWLLLRSRFIVVAWIHHSGFAFCVLASNHGYLEGFG